TRPRHRVELTEIAERDLGALTIAEKLGSSAAAALGTNDPSLPVWRALFQSDTDTLRNDARASRTAAPDSVTGSELARKLAAHPTSWEAAERYATWLEDRGSYASARPVLERWASPTQPASTPFPHPHPP